MARTIKINISIKFNSLEKPTEPLSVTALSVGVHVVAAWFVQVSQRKEAGPGEDLSDRAETIAWMFSLNLLSLGGGKQRRNMQGLPQFPLDSLLPPDRPTPLPA